MTYTDQQLARYLRDYMTRAVDIVRELQARGYTLTEHIYRRDSHNSIQIVPVQREDRIDISIVRQITKTVPVTRTETTTESL